MSPLSRKQKSVICQLARRAFRKHLAEASQPVPFEPAFAEWRYAEQKKAVGKFSLRSCTQDDYKKLEAHFLDLAGESGRALNSLLDDATNPRRVAMAKLLETLRERDLPLAYAAAILKGRHLTIDDATVEQLWHLVFTVRNRKKVKAANPEPEPVHAAAGDGEENPF